MNTVSDGGPVVTSLASVRLRRDYAEFLIPIKIFFQTAM